MKSEDEVITSILNNPRNNPALLRNILEAIDAGTPDDQETLQDYLDQREFKLFGLKAYAMSIDYQETMAEETAVHFFNQSRNGE
jgi:hypothetical protein